MTVAQLAEVLAWLPGHKRYTLWAVQPGLPLDAQAAYTVALIDNWHHSTVTLSNYEQAAQLLLIALT